MTGSEYDKRSQRDSTEGETPALHTANPGSVPGTTYSPLSTARSDEQRARNKSWAPLGVAQEIKQLKNLVSGPEFDPCHCKPQYSRCFPHTVFLIKNVFEIKHMYSCLGSAFHQLYWFGQIIYLLHITHFLIYKV